MGSLELNPNTLPILIIPESTNLFKVNMGVICNVFAMLLLGGTCIVMGQGSPTGSPSDCQFVDENNVGNLSMEQLREIVVQCSQNSAVEICGDNDQDERDVNEEKMMDERKMNYVYWRWRPYLA